MKAPDHPVPSGDREMARLLVQALRTGGHEVSLPSPLRCYARDSALGRLAAFREQAEVEAEQLVARWRGAADKPDIWFTYHLYYKSPDLLGPRIARALQIPYIVAEASWAGKRNRDQWQPWQATVEESLTACDLIFCYTQRDMDGLSDWPGLRAPLQCLPPFIDASAFPPPAAKAPGPEVALLASAMMRPGNKTESYRFLAQALRYLPKNGWELTIVGDGQNRGEVAAAFAGFPADQIHFAGQLDAAATIREMAAADIFVWPGVREAYGMVYLEAQACGTPVVALDSGGAAATFAPGRTGLLVADLTPPAYAAAIAQLMSDAGLREQMGREARRFVVEERSVSRAAEVLSAGLEVARQTARAI